MAKSAEVEIFIVCLTGYLTREDRKIEKQTAKRGGVPNIYRLGLYMEAVDHVRADCADVLKSDSPQAIATFKASLLRRFTHTNGKFRLRGLNTLDRHADRWLSEGRFPAYPVSKH